jgi:hypothetical protein
MSSSDVGSIDHEVPQSLILSSPNMLRPHSFQKNTIFLVIISKKRVPFEVKDRVNLITFELLHKVKQEQLKSDIVRVFQRL